MDAPGFVEVDATPLTLNAIAKAFHVAFAPQLLTIAAPTTSVPKGPSKDLGDGRKQINILQEGLKKQADDIDRRFSQMIDQMAQMAGSMKRIGGLLRPAPTVAGS